MQLELVEAGIGTTAQATDFIMAPCSSQEAMTWGKSEGRCDYIMFLDADQVGWWTDGHLPAMWGLEESSVLYRLVRLQQQCARQIGCHPTVMEGGQDVSVWCVS